MKSLTKTVFAVALSALVSLSSATTTFAAEPAITFKSTPALSGFNKIWVSGNVKIVLTQGEKESIIGMQNFDAKKTSVLSKGQTLYINSTESDRVTLNITVKDLQRVQAYGHSVVVTSNNFDVKYLQLFLNQSAKAKINTTAGSIYTVVKDDAVLKLTGTAQQSTMVASNIKNVKMADFASLKSVQYASEAIMTTELALSK
ncbi:GIN domain-containing protein [Pedobacter sp. JCM 36344]|uniref:GIN domain-containing protein n=1 Tax=Pedobacter sp. JCM 36344 TaxID=3374280 RepID=UPI00397CA97F